MVISVNTGMAGMQARREAGSHAGITATKDQLARNIVESLDTIGLLFTLSKLKGFTQTPELDDMSFVKTKSEEYDEYLTLIYYTTPRQTHLKRYQSGISAVVEEQTARVKVYKGLMEIGARSHKMTVIQVKKTTRSRDSEQLYFLPPLRPIDLAFLYMNSGFSGFLELIDDENPIVGAIQKIKNHLTTNPIIVRDVIESAKTELIDEYLSSMIQVEVFGKMGKVRRIGLEEVYDWNYVYFYYLLDYDRHGLMLCSTSNGFKTMLNKLLDKRDLTLVMDVLSSVKRALEHAYVSYVILENANLIPTPH